MPILTTSTWYDRYSTDLIATQPVTVNIPFSADTYLQSNAATKNYATNTSWYVGDSNASAAIGRAWGKPDFSSIPANATFLSSIFHPTPIADLTSNARTMRMHRCLRDVVANQATWNIWKTSNNWGTAGASNNSTDYDGAVEIGNMACLATPVLNVAMSMTLAAAEFQKLYDGTYTNNGIVLFMDTQTDDMTQYASQEHATSAYRPYFTVIYMLN
jgi:hypothetical protein